MNYYPKIFRVYLWANSANAPELKILEFLSTMDYVMDAQDPWPSSHTNGTFTIVTMHLINWNVPDAFIWQVTCCVSKIERIETKLNSNDSRDGVNFMTKQDHIEKLNIEEIWYILLLSYSVHKIQYFRRQQNILNNNYDKATHADMIIELGVGGWQMDCIWVFQDGLTH